ncbi:MAG TPA: hypothetical protein PKD64_11370 [Pirellulaceae bacterium]|nr:hypothetical protein [Pirellulaceae bacterium]
MMRHTLTCLFMCLSITTVGFGQLSVTNTAERVYGQGVHAYFAGQLHEALDLFERAAAMGSNDPRLFYFRGLTQKALGNEHAAQADFDLGANYEVNATSRVYPVNQALQRIQGYVRMEIESSRNRAAVHRASGTHLAADGGSRGTIVVNRPVTGALGDSDAAFTTAPRVQREIPSLNYPDVSGVNDPTSLVGGRGEAIPVPGVQGLKVTPPAQTVDPTRIVQPADNASPGDAKDENPFEKNDADPDPFGDEDGQESKDDAEVDPFGGVAGGETMNEKDEDKEDTDPFGNEKDADDSTDEGNESEGDDDSDTDPFGGGDDDSDPFGDDDEVMEEEDDDDAGEDDADDDSDPFGVV